MMRHAQYRQRLAAGREQSVNETSTNINAGIIINETQLPVVVAANR